MELLIAAAVGSAMYAAIKRREASASRRRRALTGAAARELAHIRREGQRVEHQLDRLLIDGMQQMMDEAMRARPDDG